MNIHEYQGSAILVSFGVEIQHGLVAAEKVKKIGGIEALAIHGLG